MTRAIGNKLKRISGIIPRPSSATAFVLNAQRSFTLKSLTRSNSEQKKAQEGIEGLALDWATGRA
ncbi:MAG: hypothetical protein JRF30_11995 [Deltaproteobacteria bacterium]|nr:hypothetical protein [Deltaproteobacteria bacterium]